jgi:hypothetical protein
MAAPSLKSIAGDEKLVLDFFVSFSRFEYALKRSGFVKGAGPSRPPGATPAWDTFGRAIDAHLSEYGEPTYAQAKAFLLASPPQKQVFVPPNNLAWKPNEQDDSESETQYLLRLVRTVRNNLFHGGKFPADSGGLIDSGALRNAKLLNAALVILTACRSIHEKVRNYYEEAL